MPVNIIKSSGTYESKGYAEKGTWTPALFADNTEVTGLTYSRRIGEWTRSNQLVHATFQITMSGINLSSFSTNRVGIGGIDGLPAMPAYGDYAGDVMTTGYTDVLTPYVVKNGNVISVYKQGLNTLKFQDWGDLTNTTKKWYLHGSITYAIDSGDSYTPIDVVNLIYPVGSIFMNVNNTNPSILFPGTTWVAWGEGKVPVGVNTSDTDFNTSEKMGGNKTVSGTYSHSHEMAHTHSVSHNHTLNAGHAYIETTSQYLQYAEKANTPFTPTWAIQGVGSAGMSPPYDAGSSTKLGGTTDTSTPTTSEQSNTSTSETNINISTNVIQPYITCYMWKRTA